MGRFCFQFFQLAETVEKKRVLNGKSIGAGLFIKQRQQVVLFKFFQDKIGTEFLCQELCHGGFAGSYISFYANVLHETKLTEFSGKTDTLIRENHTYSKYPSAYSSLLILSSFYQVTSALQSF